MDAIDILTGDANELLIRRGDFAFGISDSQHIAHLGQAEKGAYAQSPTVGAGITRHLNGTSSEEIARDYRLEMEKDGYNVKSISFVNGQLSIDYQRVK